MYVYFDSKLARGGGQVVLEQLLEKQATRGRTALVMPAQGRHAMAIPEFVEQFDTASQLLDAIEITEPIVLICNANASLPDTVKAASALRARGSTVATVAIVHNYPTTFLKSIATKSFLKRIDIAVVVEPGLVSLRPDAVIPSWLGVSVPSHSSALLTTPIQRTGVVKSYGRPDRSKGLHHLPQIFAQLERNGFECHVALGDALESQERYRAELARDLAPWLVDGRRESSWINAGDVFVVPSVGGEAACLSAQEAMSNGAFVVASRIGLMSYLSPTNQGVRTFAIDDADGALSTLNHVLTMDEDDFGAECHAGVRQILAREGRWYAQTLDIIEQQLTRITETA